MEWWEDPAWLRSAGRPGGSWTGPVETVTQTVRRTGPPHSSEFQRRKQDRGILKWRVSCCNLPSSSQTPCKTSWTCWEVSVDRKRPKLKWGSMRSQLGRLSHASPPRSGWACTRLGYSGPSSRQRSHSGSCTLYSYNETRRINTAKGNLKRSGGTMFAYWAAILMNFLRSCTRLLSWEHRHISVITQNWISLNLRRNRSRFTVVFLMFCLPKVW